LPGGYFIVECTNYDYRGRPACLCFCNGEQSLAAATEICLILIVRVDADTLPTAVTMSSIVLVGSSTVNSSCLPPS
jgi:hypothetical protein